MDAFKKQCSFWYLRTLDTKVCPILVFKVSKPKIIYKSLTSVLDVCQLLHAAARFPRGNETREAIDEKAGWTLGVSLDDLERRKISWHCREQNQDSSVKKPVSYTLFWEVLVQTSLYRQNNQKNIHIYIYTYIYVMYKYVKSTNAYHRNLCSNTQLVVYRNSVFNVFAGRVIMILIIISILIFSCGVTANSATLLLSFLDQTYTNPVGLIWTSDQLVAEASTYKTHNKHKRRTSMPQWDSSPRTQQTSEFGFTP